MLHNPCLAKSIADAAWHQLVRFMLYKAERAGRACVIVDPDGTTQSCSRCGRLVKKSLAVRMHVCLRYGLKMDRMKMQLSTNWHWGYNAWTPVLEATPLQRLWSSREQIWQWFTSCQQP